MKTLLCIISAVFVFAISVFANDRGVSDFPEELNEAQFKDGAKSGIVNTGNMPVSLSLNTGKQELAPAIRNGVLYYIVEDDAELKYYEFELPDTDSTGDQVLGTGNKTLKGKLNGKLNDVLLNFSLDGEQVLLSVVDEKSSMKKLYIGSSEYMTDIKKLKEFPYNSKKYSIGRTTVSPDGNRLVFSSGKKGSVGGIDLWLCNRKNGSWSYPENLGKLVNTKLDEAMPFFVSDTRLYFASEGHTGYGKYDLYYTDWDGKGFTPPVNMGSHINTADNEMGICFSNNSDICYFASDKRGNYDIYKYKSDEVYVNNVAPLLAIEESISDQKSEEISVPVYSNVFDVSNNVGSVETSNDIPEVKASVTELAAENDVTVIAKDNESVVETSTDIKESSSPKSAFISGEQFALGSNNDSKLSSFYSVQIAAVSEKTFSKKYFKTELDQSRKYFTVREEGWVKIRTARFSSYRDAYKYATIQGIDKFYIVKTNEGQIDEYL